MWSSTKALVLASLAVLVFFFLFFFTRSPAVLVPLEAGEMRVLAGVSFGGLMLEAAASHWLLLAGWRALL